MLEPLLTECKNLIKTSPNSSVAHMFKEANGCVDQLTRMGVELVVTNFHFLFNRMWWLSCWLEIKLALFVVTNLWFISLIQSVVYPKKKKKQQHNQLLVITEIPLQQGTTN